jgi:hypothetical protein
MIKKFIKDILTGIDNETFDHGRVMSLFSFISYVGYAVVNLALSHPWGAMDFAGGLSALAVGFGVHLKLKQDTEPGAKL